MNKQNKEDGMEKIRRQCRLCGKSGRRFKNIFKSSIKIPEENQYKVESIPKVIQDCLNFLVTKEKTISNIICDKCIKELTSWSKFKNQCMKQQKSNNLKCDESNYAVGLLRQTTSLTNLKISHDEVENEENKEAILSVQENKEIKRNENNHNQYEKCFNCKSIFKNVKEQRCHRTTNDVCTFTCSQCSKIFYSKDILRKHFQIHSRTKNFCCHECGLLFHTRQRLYRHSQSHAPLKHQCPHCPKQFHDASGLEIHVRSHTGEKPFKCSECEAHFSQHSLMTRHVDAVHKKIKRFICSTCNKLFLYKNHYTAHLKLHAGEKDMVCNVCDKRFVTKNALNRHKRNHTGEKPYPCPECDKKFADCSNRKRHFLQHHVSPANKLNTKYKRTNNKCKTTEINKINEYKALPSLRNFLEDPELILGNLNEKRDENTTFDEAINTNLLPDELNEFDEPVTDISETDTLTLNVLEDGNKSLDFLSNQVILQYDNISPEIDDDQLLQIKNKLIVNELEHSNNLVNSKLEDFQILNHCEEEKDGLNESTLSTYVLNLDYGLSVPDMQPIESCETQSLLKMLNNQGTILLTFPENEDFSN